MLTLTLVAALTGSIHNVHHSASLTSEAPTLGTGMLLAQDAPPPQPPAVGGLGLAQPLTLQQLHAERDRLDASRPSLGGPIAMLAVGVALTLAGVGFGLSGAYLIVGYAVAGVFSGASTVGTAITIAAFVVLGIGVVLLAVGIPLAIIGGVRLKRTLNERSAIGVEMGVIEEKIKALEDVAPPPPVLPNSVERNAGPAPTLVVSTF
jgi:hypothetical protein